MLYSVLLELFCRTNRIWIR